MKVEIQFLNKKEKDIQKVYNHEGGKLLNWNLGIIISFYEF